MRYAIHLLFVILICGCGGEDRLLQRNGKGGKVYGGVFSANEGEELRSLFPLSLTQAASHRIASQVFEGLIRFDPVDLSIHPALATSWEVDPTGTIYTFTLRDGVSFHDDASFPGSKGRPVMADDVVYCLTELCTYSESNQMFWLFQDRVVGANAHFAATAKGTKHEKVAGIEALDDRTVRVTLLNPWPSFLQVLAHQGCWIWPKEMVEHYGEAVGLHPVGTGPFKLKTYRVGEALILERNPHYWRIDSMGNSLPFLDAIRYTFIQDKLKELEEFEKGNLSAVYELSVDRTDVMNSAAASGYQVQSVPGLSVQFYGFNTLKEPFKDKRIRQAFSLAVDRSFLVDSVLGGLGIAATRGVVPPGFRSYPYDVIPEQHYDPERARALLAEAGYPKGAGLPAVYLQVNNSGFGYIQVAGEVQNMLERELGARVITSVLPSEQHFEKIERGDAIFWREGWVADHPDPENFLALFYGKNAPLDDKLPASLNTTRYRNARFDSLYQRAQRTTERDQRLALLAQAEKQLMEDDFVIPLYYERSVRLLQAWVMDLASNGMEYRDLGTVWFDPAKRPAR